MEEAVDFVWIYWDHKLSQNMMTTDKAKAVSSMELCEFMF